MNFIYKSRNLLGVLVRKRFIRFTYIYKSRNLLGVLVLIHELLIMIIYKSRNLLGVLVRLPFISCFKSTKVEICWGF